MTSLQSDRVELKYESDDKVKYLPYELQSDRVELKCGFSELLLLSFEPLQSDRVELKFINEGNIYRLIMASIGPGGIEMRISTGKASVKASLQSDRVELK